jgi:hypothetical protein
MGLEDGRCEGLELGVSEVVCTIEGSAVLKLEEADGKWFVAVVDPESSAAIDVKFDTVLGAWLFVLSVVAKQLRASGGDGAVIMCAVLGKRGG